MAVTDYKVVQAPSTQIEDKVKEAVQDGWSPIGSIWRHNDQCMQALIKGTQEGGASGKDGLSAYELAVQEGFEGSLTEWLESLHGKDGEDGKDGNDGNDGETPSLAVVADPDSGLQAASSLQELAEQLSSRIKLLEEA